jgi:uncharacterized membrane-anchored protein
MIFDHGMTLSHPAVPYFSGHSQALLSVPSADKITLGDVAKLSLGFGSVFLPF